MNKVKPASTQEISGKAKSKETINPFDKRKKKVYYGKSSRKAVKSSITTIHPTQTNTDVENKEIPIKNEGAIVKIIDFETVKNQLLENEMELLSNVGAKIEIIENILDEGYETTIRDYSNQNNAEFLDNLKDLSETQLAELIEGLESK